MKTWAVAPPAFFKWVIRRGKIARKSLFNAQLTTRNMGGSFIDWTLGYNSFGESFSAGKRDETSFFTRLEKPLVTPYIPSTGSLEAGFYQTANAYFSNMDSTLQI
jgi:hypothetical protein